MCLCPAWHIWITTHCQRVTHLSKQISNLINENKKLLTIYCELCFWWSRIHAVVVGNETFIVGCVRHECPSNVQVICSLLLNQPSSGTTSERFIRNGCIRMLWVIQLKVTVCPVIFRARPQHRCDPYILGLCYTPHEDRLPLPHRFGADLKRDGLDTDGLLSDTCTKTNQSCVIMQTFSWQLGMVRHYKWPDIINGPMALHYNWPDGSTL